MKRIPKRFRHCDSRFYPYLEKVLKRLPKEVRDAVLNDVSLQIMGQGEALGRYIPFDNPVRHLIWINVETLQEPEFQIIHTIAHEIAHWIAGRGETDLWEKEAEDLMSKWGFDKEVQAAQYYRPIHESEGYRIGRKWAQKHESDLSKFEEYYDEWNEDNLTSISWEMLHYTADINSILDEMGLLVREEELSEEEKKDVAPDGVSLDKGVIFGIMGFLREKRQKRQQRYQDIDRQGADFLEFLERINNDFSKLSMIHKFVEYAHTTTTVKLCSHCKKKNGISLGDAWLVVSATLERVKENFEKQEVKGKNK